MSSEGVVYIAKSSVVLDINMNVCFHDSLAV